MVLVLVGTGGLILVVGLVLIVMRTGAETHSNIEMKGVKIAGPTGLVLTALGAGLMVTGFVLQQREPHVPTVANPPAPQVASVQRAVEPSCDLASLHCDRIPKPNHSGRELQTSVYDAEESGEHAKAICLARFNLNSSDTWLAGASYYETSRAWQALGCNAPAIEAIERSLSVRPRDRSWAETCNQCRAVGGKCALCK